MNQAKCQKVIYLSPALSYVFLMRLCFICGGSGEPAAYFYFWKDHKFDLHWCESCGVGWVPQLPTTQVFSDAYERLNFLSWKDKTPIQLSKDIKRAYLKGARVGKAFQELRNNHQRLSDIRVLEVGSNIGAVLRGLIDTLDIQTSQAVGIDFSRNHAEVSEQKFGIHTLVDTLDSAAPKLGNLFDLILCHHIIEHDEDPANFVGTLKSLLKPGGYISFELPNGYREMLSFRSDLAHGITPQTMINHVNYFSPKGFRKLLKKQSFNIKHLCSLNANKAFYDFGWTIRKREPGPEANRICDIPNQSVNFAFDDEAISLGIKKAQIPSRFIGTTHKLRAHYPDFLPLGRDIEAYVATP